MTDRPSRPVVSQQRVVYVEYRQFIVVFDVNYDFPSDRAAGRFVWPGQNLVVIRSEEQYHEAPLEVQYWSQRPPKPDCDDSGEVSFVSTMGYIEVRSLTSGPAGEPLQLQDGPGRYRLRACVWRSPAEPPLAPTQRLVERYLIQVFPDDAQSSEPGPDAR
jgi:hypothetical protein